MKMLGEKNRRCISTNSRMIFSQKEQSKSHINMKIISSSHNARSCRVGKKINTHGSKLPLFFQVKSGSSTPWWRDRVESDHLPTVFISSNRAHRPPRKFPCSSGKPQAKESSITSAQSLCGLITHNDVSPFPCGMTSRFPREIGRDARGWRFAQGLQEEG